MKDKLPPISVIIPTYNRWWSIVSALNSVLNQSFKDIEIIVIDDGSTDNTFKLLKEFLNTIRYYRHPYNKGVAWARNQGIKMARHNFIAFLDSDDKWKENKLEIQIKKMEENPQFLISHTEEIWYRNGKRLNPKKKHKKQGGDIFLQSLSLCAISMSTVMVKRTLFEKIGYFDESLPVCEDYDMWLRVSARFEVLLIEQPLTIKFGGHKDQLSKQYLGNMDKYRIQSIVNLLEKGNLSKQKYLLAIKELKRKCLIYGKGCLKRGKTKEGNFYLRLPEKYLSSLDEMIIL
jgi:glycosyltransferase involved in cell wall biosynthesis